MVFATKTGHLLLLETQHAITYCDFVTQVCVGCVFASTIVFFGISALNFSGSQAFDAHDCCTEISAA